MCERARALLGLPRLFELSGEDLQVVEGPADGQHHLGLIAGSHADVPALRLLPLAHQRLAVLEHQPHGARRDLEAHVDAGLVFNLRPFGGDEPPSFCAERKLTIFPPKPQFSCRRHVLNV